MSFRRNASPRSSSSRRWAAWGIIPEPDDLRALGRLCRDAGVHLIADEVTTGCGRTGAMSRTLDLGIKPDLLVLGKNLTSGYVPVAALLVSAALYELAANPHPPRFLPAGSATDGHPVACAAGLAVLGTYHRDDILAHVRRTGAMLRERLEPVHAKWIAEGSVAGAGLMIHFTLLQAGGEPWTFPALGAFRTECETTGCSSRPACTGRGWYRRSQPPRTTAPRSARSSIRR